jgi:hypothetical protein
MSDGPGGLAGTVTTEDGRSIPVVSGDGGVSWRVQQRQQGGMLHLTTGQSLPVVSDDGVCWRQE